MAKYNFSDEERSGIWEAHDRMCCFCRRLLPWENMNADHLIPESLEEKPEELEKVKRSLSLPKDFKVNDFENWVPNCGSCNRRKSSTVFDPAPIYLQYIKEAREKAPRARRKTEWFQKNAGAAKIRVLIDSSIKQNKLPLEEWEALKGDIDKLFTDDALPTHSQIIPLSNDLAFVRTASGAELKFEQGAYGIGWVPPGDNPHFSFECPHCGSLGPWNGARCMTCGQVSEPD